MKYQIENEKLKPQEPLVHLRLEVGSNENGEAEVELVGTTGKGVEWLLATFTPDGRFQPNKNGAEGLGLIADPIYFKT